MNNSHAVLIHIQAIDFDQMVSLEDKLIDLLEGTRVGEHDGHEIGQGETTLWLYGANADELFAFIKPTLLQHPFSQGARIVLRYGEPGSLEKEIQL
ncbi:MAG: hypothetical protein JF584_09275 [Acidobacteria bacterium]|nr:hypothetical protein [Acidobacteriota bacterium]